MNKTKGIENLFSTHKLNRFINTKSSQKEHQDEQKV